MIPVAERLGLVRLLDHRVLELLVSEMAAVPTLQRQRQRLAGFDHRSGLVDARWARCCAPIRAWPSGSSSRSPKPTVIHDIDDTRGFVSRVKDLGCRIAIDDFGSGYTSFRNLRKLGVDILKIDGAFVQNLMRTDDDRAFVSALVDLAKRLGIKTVAEWVQDEAAAALLADWGCDYLQGALIGLATIERPWGDALPVIGARPRRHLIPVRNFARVRTPHIFVHRRSGMFPHEQGLIRPSGHRKVRSPILCVEASRRREAQGNGNDGD